MASWWPRPSAGQVPPDTALLATPPVERATCTDESATLPASAGRGARAFRFDVGSSLVQAVRPDGQVLSLGPAMREINVLFDSLGRPIALTDEVTISRWHVATVVVRFQDGPAGTGYRNDMTTDSAAILALAEREGPSAAIAGIRQASRSSREPLDLAWLRRARALAEELWRRGCR